MSRIKPFLIALGVLAGAASPALAQSYSGSVEIGGLMQRVAPYGSWVDDSTYGQVFLPQDGYTPYTNGHWDNTRYGQTWIEDASDPIGAVVCHYGRWVYADSYGRYVWIPDTTWGPGWVDWQQSTVGGDDLVGWAPLPPTGYSYVPDHSYRWTSRRYLGYRDLPRYYVPSRTVMHGGWRSNWHQQYVAPRTWARQSYRYEVPHTRSYPRYEEHRRYEERRDDHRRGDDRGGHGSDDHGGRGHWHR